MSNASNTRATWTALTGAFLGLVGAFYLEARGDKFTLAPVPPADPQFTNTATVRMTDAELVRSGGDASGLDCYACHEKGKAPELKFDGARQVILAKEHGDLVMLHGRSHSNDNCSNCHDPQQLDSLVTRDGRRFKLTESTPLCGSCHGPNLRDWEAGIHGRTSGYWNRRLGPTDRQECVACHSPHAPAFPPVKPAPAPRQLHPLPFAPRAEKKGK